jgi:hypothetical protein
MNNPIRTVFLLLGISIVIVGCATTPTVQNESPVRKDLSGYKEVQVIVEAPSEIRQQTGYNATSAALFREFVGNVQALDKYTFVGAQASNANALQARLKITDLNYVHGAARGLVGIMAGRAILGVTMEVKDKRTGSVLGVVKADHSSSHLQGVFSPTTGRQVSAIAKELSLKL